MLEPICSTPGCIKPTVYKTRGLCRGCYDTARSRERRGGTKTRPSDSNVSRFEALIAPGADGCWQWTGRANRSEGGYGTINLQGRQRQYAHRWSYEYHRAPIPEGLEIDHLCRNTLCVNPWHLEPVTRKVNAERTAPATKTHCIRGHEFTPENTKILTSRRGRRVCKTCARMHNKNAQRKRRRASQAKPPALFCKNGHPMSGDNLVVKSGIRVCRACRRKAASIGNAKRWGTPSAYPPEAS